MKNYYELSRDEEKEVVELFSNWLNHYTHSVIIRVMEKRNEIINNEFAMNLLRELYKRQQEEEKDFSKSIELFFQLGEVSEYDPHNHPLTHSNSYRDVLYDMYIRQ